MPTDLTGFIGHVPTRGSFQKTGGMACQQPFRVGRSGSRVALGFLLAATIYFLYTATARLSPTLSSGLSGLATTGKDRHALNFVSEPANTVLGGRWRALSGLSEGSDALPNGYSSPYTNMGEIIPVVHGGELRKRDSDAERSQPQQPLRFSTDSLDESQGRGPRIIGALHATGAATNLTISARCTASASPDASTKPVVGSLDRLRCPSV